MDRIVLVSALLVLGTVAFVPTANADWIPPCAPYLPLYDDVVCVAEHSVRLAQWAYETVTCDVVGGPVCGPLTLA